MKRAQPFCLLLPFVFLYTALFAKPLYIPVASLEKPSLLKVAFQKSSSAFKRNYTDLLQKIILNDLNHIGDFSAEELPYFSRQNLNTKRKNGYEIQVTIAQKQIELRISQHKKRSLALRPLPMTGEIAQDRKNIHRFLHAFGKKILGVDSILNTTILYANRVKKRGKWISEIWRSDYDGQNAQKITHLEDYATHPQFLPNQKDFVFVSYQEGVPKIMEFLWDTKHVRKKIFLRGSQALPAISADGKNLAFVSDAAGRPDLFFLSLDNQSAYNKPRQLFSKPGATQASSCFSPDGKKLAFVSDWNGSPKIYLLDLPKMLRFSTPKITLITQKKRQNTSPSWSPDGRKLAYSAKTEGIRQIWVYDFETKQETQVTFGKKHLENPKWAKDSKHIVCNSDMLQGAEIYLMHVDKKTIQQISNGVGYKKFPSPELTRVHL